MHENERLAALWVQAQPTLSAYIVSVIGDFNQADDVLQQTAMAVVRKFPEYDPQRPFLAWALGIARIEILRHLRATARDKHVFDETLTDQLARVFQGLAGEFDAQRQALRECLEATDGRARQVLEMRYEQGLQPAAMAGKLEMNAEAIRSLLYRVRGALRECIERRLRRAAR